MERKKDRSADGDIFSKFFQMSPDLLCIADLDGYFKKVNPAMIKTLGWKEKELLHRPWIEFVHPEDRQLTEAVGEIQVKRQQSVYFENRYQDKDGSYHWLAWSSWAVPEKELIFAVGQDITKQKEMEEEQQRHRRNLEERIQRRIELLAEINRIFGEALVCVSKGQLGHVCLTAAQKITGSKFGFIGELDQSGKFSTFAISNPPENTSNMPKSKALHLLVYLKKSGLRRRILKDGETQICNDLASNPDWLKNNNKPGSISSFMGVPLKVGDRIYGMVGLADKEGGYDMQNQEDMEALAVVMVESLMKKEAELKLGELRRHHALILSSTSEGIIGMDRMGNMTFVNPAAAQMLGYKVEELIGKNAHALWHHSKADGSPFPREECPILDTVGEGVSLSFQNDFFWRKDGTGFPVRCSRNPIIQYNKISGAVITFQDITEHKQAEDAVRQSEEMFRRTFDQSPIGAAMVDLDFHYSRVNAELSRITGYSEEELAARTFLDITHPDDVAKSVELAQRLTAGEIDHFSLEKRYIRKNGKTVWVRVSVRLIKDGAGNPLCYLPMIEDIADQKRAEKHLEKSLRHSKQIIREIVRAMALTVEVRDPYTSGHQRRVTRLAQAIAREMGLSHEQKKAIWVAGTLHDLGKIYVPAEILSRTGRLSTMESAMVKTHCEKGYEILKSIKFPWPVAKIVRQHHERLNGSGYPDGLQHDEILQEARILAVADVVEAMASHRPYRPARGIKDALEEISKNRGTLFDPEVVDACIKVFQKKGFKFD